MSTYQFPFAIGDEVCPDNLDDWDTVPYDSYLVVGVQLHASTGFRFDLISTEQGTKGYLITVSQSHIRSLTDQEQSSLDEYRAEMAAINGWTTVTAYSRLDRYSADSVEAYTVRKI